MPFRSLLPLLAITLLPSHAASELQRCDGGQVIVFGDTAEHLDATCISTKEAIEELARCNVVLDRPISIQLMKTLPPGCMGEFHCGDDHIKILTPQAMGVVRSSESSLRHVDNLSYFKSILVHELSHAAYADVNCPLKSCFVTSEYLAHTMQVMSLPPSDLAEFQAMLDMETHVPRDSLNTMLYYLAPDKFLRKAWIHLNQRPNSCDYIGDIMNARVYFDRPRK